MTGPRQTIAAFRWSNKNSQQRRSYAYRSSRKTKTPYITEMFEIPYSATERRPVGMCVTLPIPTSELAQRITTDATFCALLLACHVMAIILTL